MTVSINEATGEVTAEIQGTTYRFHGTNKRMAELERVLEVPGLLEIYQKLNLQSARLTPLILATLCSSGHTQQDFDELTFGTSMPVVVKAISATITGALPPPDEEDEKRGNGLATRATGGRRGAATARSPLAS